MNTLYDGGWFRHIETDSGIQALVENHDGITCLCYDFTRADKRHFLLLHEQMSAKLTTKPQLCSLTGSIDAGEHHFDTCLRELREEAGAVVLRDAMTYHGPLHTYKGCTKVTHVYSANLNGCDFVHPVGDGSDEEESAYVRWHSLEDLLKSEDALLLASYARLRCNIIY
jgi:8-oxo-dGTP pyrophosphatase MutT (NUDIX family)